MRIRSIAVAALCVAVTATQGEGAPPWYVLATIKPIESDKPAVSVYFNPKELTIDKKVVWGVDASSTEEDPAVQFVGPEPRLLETLLTLEDKTDVRPKVEALLQLTREDEETRRPPLLTFTWGVSPFSTFKGVIESIGTKYTLFSSDGTPLRAAVNFRMREANRASTRRPCKQDTECEQGFACVQMTCQPR